MEKKKVKAILEDELVNGEIIKKWEIYETDSDFANYLLNNYSNRRELVEESAEKPAEKDVVKKTAKKK